jgi:membrane protein implicated in regulation of membrane protease activity
LSHKNTCCLIEISINELRSTKDITSIFALVSGYIVIALQYLIKSAIFETTAFSVGSIVAYLIVYRWFRR